MCPLTLDNGEIREWLEDGDMIILKGARYATVMPQLASVQRPSATCRLQTARTEPTDPMSCPT